MVSGYCGESLFWQVVIVASHYVVSGYCSESLCSEWLLWRVVM